MRHYGSRKMSSRFSHVDASSAALALSPFLSRISSSKSSLGVSLRKLVRGGASVHGDSLEGVSYLPVILRTRVVEANLSAKIEGLRANLVEMNLRD